MRELIYELWRRRVRIWEEKKNVLAKAIHLLGKWKGKELRCVAVCVAVPSSKDKESGEKGERGGEVKEGKRREERDEDRRDMRVFDTAY